MQNKIGIITLNGGENYGNILQNFAVQEVFNELDCHAETIINTTSYGRFLPDKNNINKFTLNYIYKYIRNKLNYKYNIKNSGNNIIKTIWKCKKNQSALNEARINRKAAFKLFFDNYINKSESFIDVNTHWNEQQINKYDFYVSGSDQVWNPNYPSTSSVNFLQFAPIDKRITFSPSFGVNEIPESLKPKYKKWISEIPFLSVREEQGNKIIKELCNREAKVLCDPTMCISKEKWISIEKKPQFEIPDAYLLTYFLGDRTKKYDQFINKISNDYHLTVINLFDVLDLEHYAVSPQEFIYLIRNANLVCTDSFHGTVFSIIMNTNFVTFSRIENGGSMESRLTTLLKTFNFQDRNYLQVDNKKIFEVDFSHTSAILLQKKEEVLSFMKDALNNNKNHINNNLINNSVLNFKYNCSGCSACETVCPRNCITMEKDIEGFNYPIINHNLCIDCKKCEKVCPVLNTLNNNNNIGHYCFVAYSLDENIRKKSSSGGVFTHLAKSVIEKGGVVFGASLDNNCKVVHSYAETNDQIQKFMGSKYVQSDIGNTYKKVKDFLDGGRTVLFSGTPCQINGLYASLSGKEYPNLITQDLICHGVPSPLVWEKYVSYISKSDNPTVCFRDKYFGWHYFSMLIKDKYHTHRKRLDEDFYTRLFLDNTILRPSCYNCTAKSNGTLADITLADCWLPKSIDNTIIDNDKGLSLVIVNSNKGLYLLNSADKIKKIQVDSKKAVDSQSALKNSVKPNEKRQAFFDAINDFDFEIIYKKWYKKSMLKSIKKKIIFYKTNIKILLSK